MRLRLAIGALVAAAVMVAGCGSSKSSDTGSAANNAANNAASAVKNAAAAAGVSAKCASAAQAMAAFSVAIPSMMSGTSNNMQSYIDQVKAATASAPADIAKDMKTVTDAYAAFLKALKDAGYDPSSGKAPSPAALTAIAQASDALNNTDISAASDRLDKWFSSECK